MRGRELLKKFNFFTKLAILIFSLLGKKFQELIFYKIQSKRGKFYIFLRYVLLKNIAKSCGFNVSVHGGSYFFSIQNLELGNNVSIHPMCYIDATGEISIGDDVSIAHGTSIMSTSHQFDSTEVIKDQSVLKRKTIIGNDVWIGAKSMIIAGTYIGDRSIVGASAVLTKNVPSNSVVVGNPAKRIKSVL